MDQHHHVAPQTPVHLKPTQEHELLDQDQETTDLKKNYGIDVR
jgi:hypothetical protein